MSTLHRVVLLLGVTNRLLQRFQKTGTILFGETGIVMPPSPVSRRCAFNSRIASAMPMFSDVNGLPVGPNVAAPFSTQRDAGNIGSYANVAVRNLVCDPVVGRVPIPRHNHFVDLGANLQTQPLVRHQMHNQIVPPRDAQNLILYRAGVGIHIYFGVSQILVASYNLTQCLPGFL